MIALGISPVGSIYPCTLAQDQVFHTKFSIPVLKVKFKHFGHARDPTMNKIQDLALNLV